ncbi:MAG: hypothetical protein ABIE68_01545 [bacterium]
MTFSFWPQIILILSIVVLLVIIGKKYSNLQKTPTIEVIARKKNKKNRQKKFDWKSFLINIWKNIYTLIRGLGRYVVKLMATLITWLGKITGRKLVVKSEHEVGDKIVETPLVDEVTDDESVPLMQSKAQKHLENSELDKAEELYIKIVAIEPKSTEAYMGLGKINALRKNLGDAKASYRQVMKLDPENKDAQTELTRLNEAEDKMENGEK